MADSDNLTAPLTEATRKERRLLLVMSILTLVVVPGGLRPTRIAALGVDFNLDRPHTLLAVLFAVHAYVLMAFIVAARADGRAWDERFATVRQHVAKKIHDCHLRLNDATSQTRRSPDLLNIVRGLLDDTHAHLRPATIKQVRYDLSVAEIALNFDQFQKMTEWQEAWTTFPGPRPESVVALTPGQMGIWRAILQTDIDDYSAPLRSRRGLRPRMVRAVYRKQLQQTYFLLRFTPETIPDLLEELKSVERLRHLARIADEERFSLDDLRAHLNSLDFAFRSLAIDSEKAADHSTQITLAGPLQGAHDATWKLHDHVKQIEADFDASMRRFGGNAFWERGVPVAIGVSTFVLAAMQVLIAG